MVLEPAEKNQVVRWLQATVPNSGTAKLTLDSRAIESGDVFFAIPGGAVDGRNFIAQAIQKGVAAILWESEQSGLVSQLEALFAESGIPNHAVNNLKQSSGEIASLWYGLPSQQLHVIAYTGTSGKTSCTTWCSQLFAQLGQRCAVIGTRGIGESGASASLIETGLTTPQALELQSAFARFVKNGVQSVAIEASSIGLEEGRLNGTSVKTAVFTNLTRDHLDYHGSMQAYAQAKRRLLGWQGLETVIINADDPYADFMSQAVASNVLTIFVSTQAIATVTLSGSKHRKLFARNIQFKGVYTVVEVDGDYGLGTIQLEMAGLFNVSNVLTVMACAFAQGFTMDAVVSAVQTLRPVEGRMQMVSAAQQPLVVIDYAHKPDALEQVLQALQGQAFGRGGHLWCVLGCGGDRDPGKRPLMDAIAQRLADRVVLTSDNPRNEDPQAIIDAIASGMSSSSFVRQQVDRKIAIHEALAQAQPSDIVLIAGKGHETYQEVLGKKFPFSDERVVREYFASMASKEAAC